MADTRENATTAFDAFLESYQAKYPKACECLSQNRDELLAFYDFPAEHWKHLRTTNPISSRHSPRSACGTVAPKTTAGGGLAWP
jgi:transposase-like protein